MSLLGHVCRGVSTGQWIILSMSFLGHVCRGVSTGQWIILSMLFLGHVCRGGLHGSMGHPQHVVSGTCLQGGLHGPKGLPQHVVSRTCLQDSRINTKESFSSEVHRLLRTDGVPTSLTLLFWRWLTVSSVFAGRSARTSYLFIYFPPSPSPLPPTFSPS